MEALLDQLEAIEAHVLAFERRNLALLPAIHPRYRESARNLLHYVALRQLDLRRLQLDLARHGLSSLGRSEGAVLSALRQVRRRIAEALDADRAEALLHERTRALLGHKPAHRHVSVMVTAPSAAEADRPCRVLMDVAGPQLRTGAMAPGPSGVSFRPRRDAFGRVVQDAVVPILAAQDGPPASAALLLPAEGVALLSEGDLLRVTDTRGRCREVRVTGVQGDRAVGRTDQSLYLAEGCRVEVRRQGRAVWRGAAGPVPAQPQAVELVVGDRFVLAGDLVPGQPALRGASDEVVHPAIVPCSLPQALDHLAPGERVLFDDGRIEALVESVQAPRATLRVVRAGGGRARLRAEKGINFPETRLEVDAVTDQDRRHLAFAARHADAVGLSFLRTAGDVRRAADAVGQARDVADRPASRPLGLVVKSRPARPSTSSPPCCWRRWSPSRSG